MRGWSSLRWRSAIFYKRHLCVIARTVPYPTGRSREWVGLYVGRIVHGSDCTWVGLSQPTFRPTSKGSNWAVWVWSDCPTPVGSDCLNMKTFVGQIITVSDGAAQSVTVSNWGVAQSLRHPISRWTVNPQLVQHQTILFGRIFLRIPYITNYFAILHSDTLDTVDPIRIFLRGNWDILLYRTL
jgi:hypothetical protein